MDVERIFGYNRGVRKIAKPRVSTARPLTTNTKRTRAMAVSYRITLPVSRKVNFSTEREVR